MVEPSRETNSPAYPIPPNAPFSPAPLPPKKPVWPWIVGGVAAVVVVLIVASVVAASLLIRSDDTTSAVPSPSPAVLDGSCSEHGATATAPNGLSMRCEGGEWAPDYLAEPVAEPTTEPPAEPPAKVTYAKLTARQWLKITKNPDAYVGKAYIVYGVVTQFDAATGEDTFRADVGHKNMANDFDYETNTVLTGDADMLADVVEDDEFQAKVRVVGSFDYETQIGGEATAPLLAIDSIKVL